MKTFIIYLLTASITILIYYFLLVPIAEDQAEERKSIVGRFEKLGTETQYDGDEYTVGLNLRDRKTGKCYYLFDKFRGGSLIEEPCPED